MDKKVKFGIIGTSWWVDAMYMPALKEHGYAKVQAVAGSNLHKTAAFAKKWDLPKYYSDYQQMIRQAELDAVVIAAPNHLHYEMAKFALEQGMHVLLEKPMTMTVAEAKDLADLSIKKKLKTMVAFTYVFYPPYVYLRDLIHSGYVGRLYHLNLRYYSNYGRSLDDVWRFDKQKSGSGVLGDLGSHMISLAQMFYGDIKQAQAFYEPIAKHHQKDSESAVNDVAAINLSFENGALGQIMISSLAMENSEFGQRHSFDFHGSKGTIYVDVDWGTKLSITGVNGDDKHQPQKLVIPQSYLAGADSKTPVSIYKHAFRKSETMARLFATAIAEDKEPWPNFSEGLKVQKVINMALGDDFDD